MKRLLYLILLIAVTSTGFSEVESKEVTYQVGTEVMKGYLSQPAETPRSVPGILVVHEWWGHNDYARSRAEQLAELGYVALAVDMYGEGKKADHPKTAGQFASAVMSNQELAKARFLAAMELLKANPYVNQEKLGAIGYCFGGATVLNMARLGLDLKGVVSFHGSLASSVTAESPIQTKILVCHGGSDSFISE
ncbi:MAG: dienelactone hydrolase family protein, partial [Verrucomicrobiota bacterium]